MAGANQAKSQMTLGDQRPVGASALASVSALGDGEKSAFVSGLEQARLCSWSLYGAM